MGGPFPFLQAGIWKVSLRARGKRLEALEERKEEFPLLQFGREIPILECSAEDKMCERYSEILVKPENTETFALLFLTEKQRVWESGAEDF